MQSLGSRTITDEVPDINCLWGTPYKDANGVWQCPSDVVAADNGNTKPLIRPPFTQLNTYANYTFPKGQTVASGFSFSSIFETIKAHPYITATALGLILWFFFGGAIKHKVAKRLSK